MFYYQAKNAKKASLKGSDRSLGTKTVKNLLKFGSYRAHKE
jgi:hypothetical protein